MKAWEIWSYQPSGWPEPHPAVIVSSPSRVANKPDLNILMCSSRQATREAMPNEVILDASDGLNWPTLCKCDLLHLIAKTELKARRGQVTEERRRQIIATLNRANGWT
jgi:mRNA-degrading endonuclease toxin of MazEF toxin-antitoxin module